MKRNGILTSDLLQETVSTHAHVHVCVRMSVCACYFLWGLNLGPRMIHFNAFQTGLTWQVFNWLIFNSTFVCASIDSGT